MHNKLLDGIDALVSSFEQLHSIQDEAVMEHSSTLTAMLKDGAATDKELIHFWLDARKYAADYAQQQGQAAPLARFALRLELYEKYIAGGVGEVRPSLRGVGEALEAGCCSCCFHDSASHEHH